MKFCWPKKREQDIHRPHCVSIPAKDAIATVPPKKVIKALFDFRADDPSPLSFSQGDFSHVGTGENNLDWFKACNPLHGLRGVVPVPCFEGVAKTERSSVGSDPYQHAKNQRYASGYIEPSRAVASSNTHITEGFVQSIAGQHMHITQSRKRSAQIYGIVIYDFKAERPDELDARKGDTIVVIAQSNPEWLVAKPITRLGGPGLIPLSFIEIRDVATGQAVPDAQQAISAADIPRVEEWKEMVAAYESCRVPLGRLEFNSVQSSQADFECMELRESSQTQGRDGLSPCSRPSYVAKHEAERQLSAPFTACMPRYHAVDDIL